MSRMIEKFVEAGMRARNPAMKRMWADKIMQVVSRD